MKLADGGEKLAVSAAPPSASEVNNSGGDVVEVATAGGDGVDGGGSGSSDGLSARKTISAAAAYREICRRVSDFESDHPSYPAFLDSLVVAATLGRSPGTSGFEKETVAGAVVSLAPPAAAEKVPLHRGGASAPAAREAHQRYRRPSSTDAKIAGASCTTIAEPAAGAAGEARVMSYAATTASSTAAATAQPTSAASDRGTDSEASPHLLAVAGNKAKEHQHHHTYRQVQSDRPPASPVVLVPPSSLLPESSSPPASSAPTIAVRSEKALSAAMAEAARGPGGGREAAAILFPDELTPRPR